MKFGFLLLALASVLRSLPAAAACNNDQLTLEGSPLRLTICNTHTTSANSTAGSMHIELRWQNRIVRVDRELNAPAHSGTALAIENIELDALGIKKTLILTIQTTENGPKLQHALLIPGPTILR